VSDMLEKKTGLEPRLLNLGCGSKTAPGWINMDLVAAHPDVVAYDLRNGIPFDDEYFDAVYHAHFLEHISPEEAQGVLKECFRVLKPGGVIRVVVPDLEMLSRLYLEKLEAAVDGGMHTEEEYDWVVLNLIDQMVRKGNSQRILDFIAHRDIDGSEFIMTFCSQQLLDYRAEQQSLRKQSTEEANEADPGVKVALSERIKGKSLRDIWDYALYRLEALIQPARHSNHLMYKLKMFVLAAVMGKEAPKQYEMIKFLQTGEVHLWMYDRYSLSRLLAQIGFDNPVRKTAFDSQIPDFHRYNLDVVGSKERKPDSLYVEATRSAGAG